MGKKKNKKKQALKPADKAVVDYTVLPEAPAEEPSAENPEADQSRPTDILSSPEERSDYISDTIPSKESASDGTAEKEPAPTQISAVEEKINRDIKTRSRLRRMLPDIIRVALALTVIGVGTAIWWKPPLLTATFPVTTYKYKTGPVKHAYLYRPLAMQERYYVKLAQKLEDRYEWFAIDRRREVVALAEEPKHTFLGKMAIKRADPLGLDLEFRKIDGSEWQINFYEDAIVFSNKLLCVRLDTKKVESK